MRVREPPFPEMTQAALESMFGSLPEIAQEAEELGQSLLKVTVLVVMFDLPDFMVASASPNSPI